MFEDCGSLEQEGRLRGLGRGLQPAGRHGAMETTEVPTLFSVVFLILGSLFRRRISIATFHRLVAIVRINTA